MAKHQVRCPLKRRKDYAGCSLNVNDHPNNPMTTYLCDNCALLEVVWHARPATAGKPKMKRRVERYFIGL
jgi:hypothetical protein